MSFFASLMQGWFSPQPAIDEQPNEHVDDQIVPPDAVAAPPAKKQRTQTKAALKRDRDSEIVGATYAFASMDQSFTASSKSAGALYGMSPKNVRRLFRRKEETGNNEQRAGRGRSPTKSTE
jgi:hypothetical protein